MCIYISEFEISTDIQQNEASSSTQQQITGFVQGDALVTGAGWQAAISETPPGIPPFPGAGSVDDKKELSMQDLMQAINQVNDNVNDKFAALHTEIASMKADMVEKKDFIRLEERVSALEHHTKGSEIAILKQ